MPRNESTMVTLRVVHMKLSAEGWAIDTHVRHVRCFRLMVKTPWGNSPGVLNDRECHPETEIPARQPLAIAYPLLVACWNKDGRYYTH